MSGLPQTSFIERFFPPPAFLMMRAAGVDISDTAIKFLEFSRGLNSQLVESWGEVAIPKETVVEGEVRNEAELTKALATLGNAIGTRFVRASLPEQEAYFFRTSVGHAASHIDIMNQLEFQLEEHVPLAPSQAIIDYDRERALPNAEESIIGVTVYPRTTVEKYTNAFRAAGLFPVSFEIEAHAILRALVPRDIEGAFMVIDFGENSVGLSVISHGALHFTSTLEIAGEDLTRIIMETLSIGPDDVSLLKNTEGIVSREHPDMARTLKDVIDHLGQEVKRHVTYWNTRERAVGEPDTDIEEILLCGGNANLRGLPEHLERTLAIPVTRANVWVNAFNFDEVIPPIPQEVSLSYATAIGLALRDAYDS